MGTQIKGKRIQNHRKRLHVQQILKIRERNQRENVVRRNKKLVCNLFFLFHVFYFKENFRNESLKKGLEKTPSFCRESFLWQKP